MKTVIALVKTNTWAQIVLAVVVLVIIYLAYRGIRRLLLKPVVIPLPGGTPPTDNEIMIAELLALEMFQQLDGINHTRDNHPFRLYLTNDDRTFILTYNIFNQKYGNGYTLRYWLNNEWAVPSWITGVFFDLGGGSEFSNLRASINARMNQLSLP